MQLRGIVFYSFKCLVNNRRIKILVVLISVKFFLLIDEPGLHCCPPCWCSKCLIRHCKIIGLFTAASVCSAVVANMLAISVNESEIRKYMQAVSQSDRNILQSYTKHFCVMKII